MPLEVFTQSILSEMFNGSMKMIFKVSNEKEGYNYVEGYRFVQEGIWGPLVETIDQALSFIYSASNV